MDQSDEVEPWTGQVRAERRQMPLWQELPLLLVIAFCIAVLIRTFLLQVFLIPSGSMEDTLLIGDRVLVNKVVYKVRDPERGEIVVFHGPAGWAPQSVTDPDPGFFGRVGRTLGDLVGLSRPGEKDFIKRVIGLPGDRVMCCDEQGRVTVNGVALDEPYVVRNSPLDAQAGAEPCGSRRFDEVVVPAGQLFVMGDHRNNSADSRCQGTVPIDNVIGRAFVIVWPHSHWTTLSIPGTFDTLPRSVAAPAGPSAPPADPWGGIAVVLPLLAPLRSSTHSRQSLRDTARRLLP